MPRACPVEYYARCYTGRSNAPVWMPRACPVGYYARRYTGRSNAPVWMPRACPVEYYARRYTADLTTCLDATGLSRGASRSLLNSTKRDAPRGEPVASEHL